MILFFRKSLTGEEVLVKLEKGRERIPCELCDATVYNINRHLDDKHNEKRKYRQLFQKTILQRSKSTVS